ncbi:lachesin-like [Acropora muricata]|uniref:lachesin-like n=1 Tax=Acropora muricata TaxID=159855 RepID=UPI0034E5B79C
MLGVLPIIFAYILQFSETADITAVITKSPSPSYAAEGQNFTLEWTYTLDGSVGSAKFAIVRGDESELVIWKSFRSGIINFMPEYQERFRAQATDTRAELRILAVQRSDEETYKLNILPTGFGSIFEEVILVVNFSSSITNITGENVREGENVTLKCLAEGKPKPTITWTRLSDNRIVTMPLIQISRHDPKAYRCTADNGVGIPATGEVSIVVQFCNLLKIMVKFIFVKSKRKVLLLATEIDFLEQNCVQALEPSSRTL